MLKKLHELVMANKTKALATLGCALVAASIYLTLGGFKDPGKLIIFIEKLFEHIGVAILIALIIGYTIEKKHKIEIEHKIDHMVKKFRLEGYKAFFSWFVPHDIINETYKQILMSPFIRESANLTYILRDLNDEDLRFINNSDGEIPIKGKIVMELRLDGTIKNHTNEPQTMKPSFCIEKEESGDFNRLQLYRIESMDRTKDTQNYCYKGQDVSNYKTCHELENIYTLNDLILEPGIEYRVSIRAIALRDKAYTKEIFSVFSPTQRGTVKVKDRIGGLKIGGHISSPQELHIIEDDEYAYYAEFSKPLLTNQSVTVWWRNAS